MIHLCAFADEISPDLDEQIRVCRENDVTHIELGGVGGVNVLDFDFARAARVRDAFAAANLTVACIGSRVGKVPIDALWGRQFDRFKRAVELAEFFNAAMIRVFSYYPTGGEDNGPIEPHRTAVFDRFRAKADYLENRSITLVHENTKGTFGDTVQRCYDLMHAINSPQLRCAFDFANFVQVGEKPAANWPVLKQFVSHLHIRDARLADGKVVPAGRGDGDIESILIDAFESGYVGCLSLEPHLKAGHSHGETGADLFRTAADTLKEICLRNRIPLGA